MPDRRGRTGTLDDLRAIGERLDEAGVEGIIPINHGNAWSLYFNDPEGNGLECFVDSPFHVAQPFADGLDIGASDDEIEATTLARIEDDAEFQSMAEWRAQFRQRRQLGFRAVLPEGYGGRGDEVLRRETVTKEMVHARYRVAQ